MNNTLLLLIGTAHPFSIEIVGGNSGVSLTHVILFIDQSWVGNKAVHLHSTPLNSSFMKSGLSSQLLKPISMNPRLDIQIL